MSMVDIVKVELEGPCKSKFSLLTSSFVVNIRTRIKNSLLWHIYGISWYQLFKIVDNVTWTILLQKLLAILTAILDFETFIEE